MTTTTIRLVLGFFSALCLITASCTKTETIAPPPEPLNRILSYRITSVPAGEQPVTGVVNDVDSSITVYLPSYYSLQVVSPEITVSEGATITPSSGDVVTDVLPMMQTGQTVNYKVTGKDGSVRNYTLHVIASQPPTTINELTTDPAAPATYTLGAEAWGNFGIAFTGTNIIISNREELLKVVLTGSDGNIVTIPGDGQGSDVSLTAYTFSVAVFRTNNPDIVERLAADDLYTVTVYNYAQVVTLKNKIRIIKNS